MKLIVGAALVLSGCGASVDGPTLTWQNNAQYSTVEIERAARVGDECRTWPPAGDDPGEPEHIPGPPPAPGSGMLPPARLHDDRLLCLQPAKVERSVALTTAGGYTRRAGRSASPSIALTSIR